MTLMHVIFAMLLATCALIAVEDDPIAREMTRYDEAVAKAQKTFDESLAKERARTIPAIITIAKKLIGKGDMPGGVKAWKAVLRLDDQQAEARQFFTSIGQLDKVLAEIEEDESAPGDLLGDGAGTMTVTGKPWEGMAVIHADKPLVLGDLPAGTKLSLQYQSGVWTFRQGVHAMVNPDDVAAQGPFRLVLAGEPGINVEVGQGSAKSAWTWTATSDVKGAVLRLARNGRAPAGVVNYRITLAKPKAR
jgi:hypothetical protein